MTHGAHTQLIHSGGDVSASVHFPFPPPAPAPHPIPSAPAPPAPPPPPPFLARSPARLPTRSPWPQQQQPPPPPPPLPPGPAQSKWRGAACASAVAGGGRRADPIPRARIPQPPPRPAPVASNEEPREHGRSSFQKTHRRRLPQDTESKDMIPPKASQQRSRMCSVDTKLKYNSPDDSSGSEEPLRPPKPSEPFDLSQVSPIITCKKLYHSIYEPSFDSNSTSGANDHGSRGTLVLSGSEITLSSRRLRRRSGSKCKQCRSDHRLNSKTVLGLLTVFSEVSRISKAAKTLSRRVSRCDSRNRNKSKTNTNNTDSVACSVDKQTLPNRTPQSTEDDNTDTKEEENLSEIQNCMPNDERIDDVECEKMSKKVEKSQIFPECSLEDNGIDEISCIEKSFDQPNNEIPSSTDNPTNELSKYPCENQAQSKVSTSWRKDEEKSVALGNDEMSSTLRCLDSAMRTRKRLQASVNKLLKLRKAGNDSFMPTLDPEPPTLDLEASEEVVENDCKSNASEHRSSASQESSVASSYIRKRPANTPQTSPQPKNSNSKPLRRRKTRSPSKAHQRVGDMPACKRLPKQQLKVLKSKQEVRQIDKNCMGLPIAPRRRKSETTVRGGPLQKASSPAGAAQPRKRERRASPPPKARRAGSAFRSSESEASLGARRCLKASSDQASTPRSHPASKTPVLSSPSQSLVGGGCTPRASAGSDASELSRGSRKLPRLLLRTASKSPKGRLPKQDTSHRNYVHNGFPRPARSQSNLHTAKCKTMVGSVLPSSNVPDMGVQCELMEQHKCTATGVSATGRKQKKESSPHVSEKGSRNSITNSSASSSLQRKNSDRVESQKAPRMSKNHPTIEHSRLKNRSSSSVVSNRKILGNTNTKSNLKVPERVMKTTSVNKNYSKQEVKGKGPCTHCAVSSPKHSLGNTKSTGTNDATTNKRLRRTQSSVAVSDHINMNCPQKKTPLDVRRHIIDVSVGSKHSLPTVREKSELWTRSQSQSASSRTVDDLATPCVDTPSTSPKSGSPKPYRTSNVATRCKTARESAEHIDIRDRSKRARSLTRCEDGDGWVLSGPSIETEMTSIMHPRVTKNKKHRKASVQTSFCRVKYHQRFEIRTKSTQTNQMYPPSARAGVPAWLKGADHRKTRSRCTGLNNSENESARQSKQAIEIIQHPKRLWNHSQNTHVNQIESSRHTICKSKSLSSSPTAIKYQAIQNIKTHSSNHTLPVSSTHENKLSSDNIIYQSRQGSNNGDLFSGNKSQINSNTDRFSSQKTRRSNYVDTETVVRNNVIEPLEKKRCYGCGYPKWWRGKSNEKFKRKSPKAKRAKSPVAETIDRATSIDGHQLANSTEKSRRKAMIPFLNGKCNMKVGTVSQKLRNVAVMTAQPKLWSLSSMQPLVYPGNKDREKNDHGSTTASGAGDGDGVGDEVKDGDTVSQEIAAKPKPLDLSLSIFLQVLRPSKTKDEASEAAAEQPAEDTTATSLFCDRPSV